MLSKSDSLCCDLAMNTRPQTHHYATISAEFLRDWQHALHKRCPENEVLALFQRAGLTLQNGEPVGRVTHAQFVALYQIAALETGDEMMGLWGRPIRPRALQHMLTTMRDAETVPAALFRFTTFWNLLLDDWQLEINQSKRSLSISIVPLENAEPQRFGHMLMLKLAHGLVSWLVGREVPLQDVRFTFARPSFAQDYAALFPLSVSFDAAESAVSFDLKELQSMTPRSKSDMVQFLQRAPEDWIFTQSLHHSFSLRTRAFLVRTPWQMSTLDHAAIEFGMTARTLMRRLQAEGSAFQSIKDDVRRDLAIQALQTTDQSIEEISHTLGFSSAANFHKSFKRWTSQTPAMLRKFKQ